MNPLLHGSALALCLGMGAADLLALNLVVLPAVRGAQQARIEPEVPARVVAASAPRRSELAPVIAVVEPAPPPRAPRAPELVAIVEFESGAQRVGSRASLLLQQVLGQLRDAPELLVVGHADASGSERLNELLSTQRAAAVSRRLIGAGVPEARIRIEARGEREPRLTGNSRRVEIYRGGAP